MAFRLQSAIAGFAKRSSERLKALEEDTKELAKTEAGRIAQEIADGRKQRIKDTLDYTTAGRRLKSQYGLSDAQVYTVLQGGVEQADAFEQSVRAGAISAKQNKTEFNARNYAQNLFTVDFEGFDAPDIAAQGEAFAAARTPISASTLVDAAAQRAGVSTKTLMGSANPDYLKGLIRSQVGAAAGDMPDYTGPAFGAGLPAGAGFTRPAVTPEDMLAIRAAEVDIAKKETETESIAAGIETENLLRDLRADELRATIDNIAASAENATARTARIYGLLGLEKDKMETEINLNVGQLEKLNKGLDLMDAQIAQIEVDTSRTTEEIESIKAKVEGQLLDNAMKGIDLENYPEMSEAILNKAVAEADFTREKAAELAEKNKVLPEVLQLEKESLLANIGLTTARTSSEEATASLTGARVVTETAQADLIGLKADALEQEIFLNEKFGAREREAALDLVLEKIISENKPDDFEEYSTALLVRNDKLRERLANTQDAQAAAEIQREIDSNVLRILEVNKMDSTSTGTGSGSIFSKINPQSVFNSMLGNAGQALDLDLQFDPMGNLTTKLTKDQTPVLFQATAQAIGQMQGELGFNATGTLRGERKVIAESIRLNSSMGSYAERVKSGAIAAEPVEGASDVSQQMAAMSIRDAEYFPKLSDEPLSVRDAATLANRLAKQQKDANTPIPRGSVVQYESKLSGETITMVYMDGDWIFADADYSELDKFTIGNR